MSSLMCFFRRSIANPAYEASGVPVAALCGTPDAFVILDISNHLPIRAIPTQAPLALCGGLVWGWLIRMFCMVLTTDKHPPPPPSRRRVQFAKTKSGKVRSVPIDESLVEALRAHHKEHGSLNRVFGPAWSAWSAFREAIERAGISLPEGQMTHSLRHTFASHFMMGGGNILALQRILGHQSLTMTMRYAHLSPDHLQEAKRLNPLAQMQLM